MAARWELHEPTVRSGELKPLQSRTIEVHGLVAPPVHALLHSARPYLENKKWIDSGVPSVGTGPQKKKK